jgi:hypothetical protein
MKKQAGKLNLKNFVSHPPSCRKCFSSRTVRQPAHFWYTLDTSLRQSLIEECWESLWQPAKLAFSLFIGTTGIPRG